MNKTLLLAFVIGLSGAAWAAAEWEPVAMPDGELHARKPGTWRAYRGATLNDVADSDGRKVLRVNVDGGGGGLSITATPRGGMGNRVRLAITYRVISGSPVSVFVGPNTLNQLAGRLASRRWETALLEFGLVSDFHLIVHMVQPGPGAFELAEFKVEARPPEAPLNPARIGIADVAMDGHSPSDPALGLERFGTSLPRVARAVEQGRTFSHVTILKGTGGRIAQGLGSLPAGTQVSLACHCRIAGDGPVAFGLQSEYNSRWGFRFPTSHEAKLSPASDGLELAWHFKDDPVAYGVHMKANRPDSVLVEVRLQNGGQQPVRDFTPGFCLQLSGAYSPTTFAYTIIPWAGEPFPLSMGRYFTVRPPMWANVGWVGADFTGSEAYAQRLKQGEAFKPKAERWIHETGDFPLLARRLPGRDAWIAWLWPNATGYFGNTQSPCMHMDPIVRECPPGQTRSLFGRLLFFEGSWEQLYSLAQRERKELAVRSGLPCTVTANERKEARIAGIVLKWIRTDKEANFRRAEPMIRQAAAKGAQIVCTTECFLDGYAIADKSIPLETYRALGEPIPEGPYYKRLAALARELKILLVAGMLEADGESRYNTAVLILPDGSLLGKYRKQHLEHELVRNRPGHACPVFSTPYGRVGIMICADRRLPEIPRRLKEQGADFLLCLSGGMFGPKSNDWILQARSRETGLPIVFVHPAEFLVTRPDGLVLKQTLLGDGLLIAPSETGTPKDQNRVFYFDLERSSP